MYISSRHVAEHSRNPCTMFVIITTLYLQLIYETPPRVYIPHGSVPVVFNDYMFKDEKTEECAERAQQILGVDTIDSTTIDTSVDLGGRRCI